MFGQPATSTFGSAGTTGASTPFGQPSNAPFGSTNTTSTGGFGFGSSANTTPSFGTTTHTQQPTQTSGFGGFGSSTNTTTPAFGSTTHTTTASPFGAPAAPSTGGGLFGSTSTPSASTGGGLFGSTSTTANTGFGASTNTGFGVGVGVGASTATTSTGFGGFGSSTTNTAPSTGLFGAAPAPATGGLFGAAPAPATGGLFGSATTSTGFGASASTTTNTGFGGFGSTATQPQQPQTTGTLSVPYQVTTHSDGNDSIALQAITAMPGYQEKSFEELRMEDYAAGNKGSQGAAGTAGTSTGFGGFGSPSPASTTGGLFGSSTTTTGFGSPTPAANTTSVFGAPAAAPSTGLFGAPSPAPTTTGGLFGSPAPSTGGLFGAPAPAPATGLFGAAPAPATGGLFGAPAPAPATGGLFGAPAPAPATGGLFGAAAPAPATGGLFGAPAPAPAAGGLFGSPAPAPAPATGLFGAAPAPATGGLFGAPAPAPATGGLFGAPAPVTGGLFGAAAPAPAPASGGFGFGAAPAPATGGLFGAPAPAPAATGGLFGAPAPAPATTGGLFGSLTSASAAPAAGGGLFGALTAPAPAPAPVMGMAGVGIGGTANYVMPAPPPSSDVLLAQQLAAVEAQKKELALLEPWRGNAPDGSNVIPASLSERDAAAFHGSSLDADFKHDLSSLSGGVGGGVSSYAASSAALHSLKSPSSLTRIRPRGFGPAKSHMPRVDVSRGSPSSTFLSPDKFISSSAKRLVIHPGSLGKPKKLLQITNGSYNENNNGNNNAEDKQTTLGDVQQSAQKQTLSQRQHQHQHQSNGVSHNSNATPKKSTYDNDDTSGIVFAGGFTSPTPHKTPKSTSTPSDHNYNHNHMNKSNESTSKSPKSPHPSSNGYSYNLYKNVVASPQEKQQTIPENEKSYLPTFTKTGYTVYPSIEQMSTMSEADLAAVSNFSVKRPGYGSVEWDGAVDVRAIDLNSVVRIREREVIVYEEEEANGTKPSVGSKLNRPAVVTLHQIFPKDADGGKEASIEAKAKFTRKIEKTTNKMGADFISYDPLEGVWKFRTHHFSRYGLDDDSDDDDDSDQEKDKGSNGEKNDNGMVYPKPSAGLSLLPGEGMPPASNRTTTTTTPLMNTRGRFGPNVTMEISDDEDDNAMMIVSDNEDPMKEEGNDTNVLIAAENAYRSFMRMETSAIAPVSDNTHSNVNVEQDLATYDNPLDHDDNESDTDSLSHINQEIPSSYVIPKPISPDMNAIAIAPRRRVQGLCSRIAQNCGITSSTSVGTDFSLRMGRSFRVGWRPDGSFVFPSFQGTTNKSSSCKSFTNGTLVQSRPVFQESEPKSNLLPMLRTHMKHSTLLKTEDNGCPLFELPKGLAAAGGSVKSYKQLCSALTDYVQAAKDGYTPELNKGDEEADKELCMVASRALSLISTFYGQEKYALTEDNLEMLPIDENVMINSGANAIIPNKDSDQHLRTTADRRYEGFVSWLHEASKSDTDELIDLALKQNDPTSAILVALTGGDTKKACDLATKHGYLRLSIMISNNFSTISKIHFQRQLWHQNNSMSQMTTNMNRIYAILSGDLEIEEKLYANAEPSVKRSFDWKQRLGMKIWCCDALSNNAIAPIIDEYDEDVLSGLAPPPEPRYKKYQSLHSSSATTNTFSTKEKCILYKLLRLRASSGGKDGDEASNLLHILSPHGHTSSVNDYSLSFHIAAVLQGLGVCPSLTDEEEGRLIESYAVMLVNAGLWEWAVYVMLCVRPSHIDNSKPNRRRTYIEMKAKDFFLRHFPSFQKENAKIRKFLQNEVGIPNHWFEEALATRCAYNGDAMGYIAHLMASQQVEKAAAAIEHLIIPTPLALAGDSLTKLKHFLQSRKMEGLDNATRWDGNNGCGAILDLLLLSAKVTKLFEMPDNLLYNETNTLHEIVKKGNDLKDRIVDGEISYLNQSSGPTSYLDYHMFATLTKEERAICFAEACAKLNTLRMQIKILQSKVARANMTDDDDENYRAMGSQLAYLTYSKTDGFETISSGGLFSNSNLRGVSSSYLATR